MLIHLKRTWWLCFEMCKLIWSVIFTFMQQLKYLVLIGLQLTFKKNNSLGLYPYNQSGLNINVFKMLMMELKYSWSSSIPVCCREENFKLLFITFQIKKC